MVTIKNTIKELIAIHVMFLADILFDLFIYFKSKNLIF